ncbi:MAG: hypothetical protein H7067_04685 [Burkholderiales bacterium]|nr:hypothetical protein [Opitutaceae bacterium]
MHKLFAGFFLIFLFNAVCHGAGVREGMTRAEIEAELGRPVSVLMRGETQILNYPNQGRVELVDGKATRIVRVRHVDDPPTAAELEAAELASERARLAAEAKEAARQEALAEAEEAKLDAEAQRQVDQTIQQMSAEHQAGPGAADFGLKMEPAHFWIGLLVGVFVQIGVGVVVLKLAFAWSDVHADWSQMFLPALAAAWAGGAVRAAAYAFWDATECFHVDDAISYAALLLTLRKTTHACTWPRALAVAAAAKLMTIIVWVFLSVAITRVLFG